MIIESLSWKDTISGHSESSICVLSKHIWKKVDQFCAQLKRIYSDTSANEDNSFRNHIR